MARQTRRVRSIDIRMRDLQDKLDRLELRKKIADLKARVGRRRRK